MTDRIYQIRGFDISNMTIIEGDTSLIIIDVLLTTETARAAPVTADALDLPFPAASFDGAMVGWGVRNLVDLDAGLAEAAEQVLIEQDAWSQYLEVGIGPDAVRIIPTAVGGGFGSKSKNSRTARASISSISTRM